MVGVPYDDIHRRWCRGRDRLDSSFSCPGQPDNVEGAAAREGDRNFGLPAAGQGIIDVHLRP